MTDHAAGATLFVGLGRMGGPMARRYAATRPTYLYDADPDAAPRLAGSLPATALATLLPPPPEVDVVVLMLPTSAIVESVLLGEGEGGLLDALPAGALVLDMGSSVPASTRRLATVAAGRGIDLVDAPVSGGVSRAETGELSIMVGGRREAVERARPHLEPLGTSIVTVGPAGAGHAAKALNNLLSATNLAAAAEVLCVAQRAGIEPEVMLQVLNSSTGRSQATAVKYPQHVLTGTFGSGFELDLMVKDLAIASGIAEEVQAQAPVTRAAVASANEARRHLDRAGRDHTEIVKYYEHLNQALLRATATADGPTPTERTAP
ncbi:NAD(P)-dependent oxidoreductase [Nocardioides mesophilus]|uniref:NAD(P)-dependent oxidoreductase n=1 Tax=Nocardioides mesophilus TaxID=433659 RepID=A0A7G9RE78_9ACTN|nr:NAD(P)-dependent oxidoreductase [Nocardioides mesophilus]QNN53903.1 NAD(P)-dependent oxidoreductase [Nocardioides mesophilus]